MSSPFLDAFYASMERYFVEHPFDPARLLAEHPGWDAPPERLAIYGRFVAGHVRRALGKVYPACKDLVDPQVWSGWVRAYYAGRPSAHHQVNQATEGFAAFLSEQPNAPPYLSDLARFEWTKVTVYYDETEVPTKVESLTVNPTLETLEFPWSVCRHYCGRRKAGNPPPEAGDEVALLWRNPATQRVRTLAATPSALLVLKLALEGIEPAQAAEETGVSTERILELIAERVRTGLVLASA